MSEREIANVRLRNQRFSNPEFKTGSEVVVWFGAIQAQEYAQSRWAIGLRHPGVVDRNVEQEFQDGIILRTHILRPTWHFVHASDIRWMLKLSAPRVHVANAFMYRQLELDKAVFRKCNKAIEAELKSGEKTREELNGALKRAKVIASGPRLGYIMMNAELEALICSGPRRGNQFTYALIEQRVQSVRALQPDDPLTELTKRYFQSRGPATVHDFATWSGLTLADCRRGIASVGNTLKEVTSSSKVYFLPDSPTSKAIAPRMLLLPIYDEYIMGYKDRAPILTYRNHLKPAPTFAFDCTVIWDGQIIGTWRRTVEKKLMTVDVHFFKPLDKSQAMGLKAALHRLGNFTGLTIKVVNKRGKARK